MKLLKQIIYFIILVIITIFCVYNKSEVVFEIPFYGKYNLPLYFIIISSCITGIIIGSLNSYIASVRQSLSFRKIEEENSELQQKIEIYRVNDRLKNQAKDFS